jgi:hypothetical protein
VAVYPLLLNPIGQPEGASRVLRCQIEDEEDQEGRGHAAFEASMTPI